MCATEHLCGCTSACRLEAAQTKRPESIALTHELRAPPRVRETDEKTHLFPLKAPRTQIDNEKELAFLRRVFVDCAPLEDIEPQHVKQYMRWRHDVAVEWFRKNGQQVPQNAGHVRANREIALFSHIFNHAREIGLRTKKARGKGRADAMNAATQKAILRKTPVFAEKIGGFENR